MTLFEAVELAPLLILIEGFVGGSSFKFIESLVLEDTLPAESLNQTKTVLVPLPPLNV